MTQAALTDGPIIIRSQFCHLVFLSVIELPHWPRVPHFWKWHQKVLLVRQLDNTMVHL